MPNWPEKDFIKLLEQRIRAFEASRRNEKNGLSPEKPDHPLSEQDIEMWLSHYRDKKSLTEIARQEFRKAWNCKEGKRGKNQKAIQRVRRGLLRVEKFLNRGTEDEPFVYPKRAADQIRKTLSDLLFLRQ